MTRKIERPPAPIQLQMNEPITAKISLLTPVFGGGAESKKIDKDYPIRSASIKGQLRFWWRAARAGGYNTVEEMKEAEERLWGGPSNSGVLSLSVDSNISVQDEPFFEGDRALRGKEALSYFAFPLRPTEDNNNPKPAYTLSGSFTLKLYVDTTHPEYKKNDEVEAKSALWAWRRFGGIGGRTRRGFGAVDLGRDESIEHPELWLKNDYIINKQPPEGVPSLAPSAGAKIATRTTKEAEKAWSELASKFKRFRQGNGLGRNDPQPDKFAGRSRWPEPDVIRHHLHKSPQGASKHQTPIVNVTKAPRGQFGMPIIFHFQNYEHITDVELNIQDKERFASPLILRPVGQKKAAKAMLLILGNRPRLDSTVMTQDKKDTFISVDLNEEEAHEILPLNGEKDPLIAFMHYFKKP